jgi:phosphatidylserine/phosphatidylglycerophosphate/cardiolipin synthase-like enzyme
VAIPGQNCWRRLPAGRVAFLVDAAGYFDALAEALERAERSVFILGWDVHSELRLRPREQEGGLPCELGRLLNAIARRKPRLRIRVLDWDFSWLLMLERQILPWVRLDWRTHRRVEFRLDGRHPVGSCHHQKIVVVDDALAFAGGIDLTARRWDTPEHAPDDSSRRSPAGRPYDPIHDVQIAVDGEAARGLGRLARDRWRRATGRWMRLRGRKRSDRGDPWPPALAPDLERVEVAISRTEPAYQGRREVREVERLYLDSIAGARRSIYIENQFLTSERIADALCARLASPSGPDVAIVLPRRCSAWLEDATMGIRRCRVARRLRSADRYGRLRLYFPQLPGDSTRLNLHSKLMIVDDGSVRVGSANLSNRSMGFDTECDLVIESNGERRLERGIAAFRERLLAEHLGVERGRVAEAMRASGGRLNAAIERLAGGERTLAPLDTEISVWLDRLAPESLAADPDRPFAWSRIIEDWTPEVARDPHRRPLLLMMLAVVTLLVALAAR